MPIREYKKGEPFPGVIGRTADDSSPAWPAITRAKQGAPNVLFVVMDDTGFGHYTSPFPFTGTIDHVTVDVSGDLIRTTKPNFGSTSHGSRRTGGRRKLLPFFIGTEPADVGMDDLTPVTHEYPAFDNCLLPHRSPDRCACRSFGRSASS